MGEAHRRVREKRIRLGLSQERAAEALGVNRSTYTQMENGRRKILAEEIAVLAELFGVTADSLLYDGARELDGEQLVRDLEKLEESDRAEILALIRFKLRSGEEKP